MANGIFVLNSAPYPLAPFEMASIAVGSFCPGV